MATTDPRDALEAGAKQWLSELSDDEFTSLVNEVREPESDTPTTVSYTHLTLPTNREV